MNLPIEVGPTAFSLKFYYLKLGLGNRLLSWCLQDEPTNPRAVVFFGKSRCADLYASNKCDPQFRAFFEAGLPSNRDKTVIVVSSGGWMWFYHPAGPVKDDEPDLARFETNDPPKFLPLRPAERTTGWNDKAQPAVKLANVPAILAGLRSNRYLSSGTFRPITQLGNVAAIEKVLLGKLTTETHTALVEKKLAGLLRCLGSVELETLVARLLEESGLFVPAYRGGVIPDIDLYARNETGNPIFLDGLSIPAAATVSIQVKGVLERVQQRGFEDFRVSLASESCDNCLGLPWLESRLRACSTARRWLRRSLDWLPPELVDSSLPA